MVYCDEMETKINCYLGVVPATGLANAFRTTNIVMHENRSQKNMNRHH